MTARSCWPQSLGISSRSRQQELPCSVTWPFLHARPSCCWSWACDRPTKSLKLTPLLDGTPSIELAFFLLRRRLAIEGGPAKGAVAAAVKTRDRGTESASACMYASV